MRPVKLTGLDAQNPLAYFAALGLLRVLDYHASVRGVSRPMLAFVDEGQQVPILVTDLDIEAVIGVVLEDAAAEKNNPALRLAYNDEGHLVDPEVRGATRDLKPIPASARQFLDHCARSGRRAADLAAGFFSELVRDKTKGNSKPTALHFTAGNQTFLRMVEQIRSGITAADVREALLGPWRYTSMLPSLSWDPAVTRLYALRAADPQDEKRRSMPAAYWLGVNALPYFPVCVHEGRLITTGVKGGWKDSVFYWPVWQPALSARTISALLRTDSAGWSSKERSATGLTHVFASRIVRADYGSFSPAEVILPRAKTRQRSGA